eukprot:1160736-Pelagomonas_calceolata.AAC.7
MECVSIGILGGPYSALSACPSQDTSVRPPGMWSPPPPLRGAANKEQQQLPSKAPAAARGNAPGRARRNSCTAALTSHSNAAGLEFWNWNMCVCVCARARARMQNE